MEIERISQLAGVVRLSPSKTTNIFTISTNLLSTLSTAFEKYSDELNLEVTSTTTTTFHTRSTTINNSIKIQLLHDLYYLQKYIEQVKAVKLYFDNYLDENLIDLAKFKNLTILELHKVDVNRLRGLQRLRSQLNKLILYRTLNNLNDILILCGGDKSEHFYWNELKDLSVINNGINEIDNSIDTVPWLHTLDLSHNNIKNIDIINNLINLKHLNLSYNKLENLPKFNGRICLNLRQLILKNNFIDDLTGLQTLTNLNVLDISNNCLINHKSLLSLSHLMTLQWLNLNENPISYHPLHRIKTASYLHMNTLLVNFILDNENLTKDEKRVVGSLYAKPIINPTISMECSMNSTITTTTNKLRKVRHVKIEDDTTDCGKIDDQLITIQRTPSTSTSVSQQYLETKKQIENLRKQYGDSWLHSDSGMVVQNVLGLEQLTPPISSSSPYDVDFLLHSNDHRPLNDDHTNNKSETSYMTALDSTNNDDNNIVAISDNDNDDDDDVDLDGEESIYLATRKGEDEQIFLLITKTHLVEKECSTSRERTRWHLRSIKNIQILQENRNIIQIDFETMRRDRQQRFYIFDDDIERFYQCIKLTIEARLPEKTDIDYQCMKCSKQFSMLKKESVLQNVILKCPNCDSTLVVEM